MDFIGSKDQNLSMFLRDPYCKRRHKSDQQEPVIIPKAVFLGGVLSI